MKSEYFLIAAESGGGGLGAGQRFENCAWQRESKAAGISVEKREFYE